MLCQLEVVKTVKLVMFNNMWTTISIVEIFVRIVISTVETFVWIDETGAHGFISSY